MGNIKMGSMSPAWGGLDGMPKSITFCVTEDCNLACKYCYMTGKNRFKKMNFETAKKVVDYILIDKENFKEKSVIWEFIGGEAFVEIELVDKLTDYIKQQMFLLDHSWFNSYRLSFASNGILYDTPAVQNYIKKNKNHLSIGLSVDGNKIKHDLQRVRPNGEGSYDSVVKNVPLWLRQFPNNSTKATFSHDDIPYLKDSIISLWDIGIKNVSANVVFEDVWEEGDDILIEQQLRELADYILKNELWDNYSVRFFDPNMGNPLTEEELSSNFCGAGKMLAIDCDGNFYPCQRFYGFSLNNRKGIIIGDANTGIIKDKLRPFEALSLKSQSPMECVKCEVASGCAWCTGCNYDIAETDTVYQRATSICKMHKATVRANKYFWDKFESITGLPSERKRLAKEREQQNQKFLQFITSDNITPHCAYRNTKGTNEIMTPEVFEKGMEFCEANGFTPAFLGTPHQIEKMQYQENLIIGKAGQLDNIISIYDNNADCQDGDSIGILLLNRHNISNLYELTETLFNKVDRINLVLEDVDKWDKKDTEQYNMQLDLVVPFIAGNYNQGEELEINILTDIWNLSSMKNCDAGTGTFTLAPNGRIYMCPAFYFDDPDSYVGTLTDGICIKNPQLLELKNAPICSVCDVYNCNRCNYLNKKMTNEINTPSKMQCVISHIEREQSRKLQKLLGKYNNQFENILKKISYNDPLEKLLQR
jgi:radical SAM peptide maturase (CXXX-repeat target family)/CXXX repeat peptide maturase